MFQSAKPVEPRDLTPGRTRLQTGGSTRAESLFSRNSTIVTQVGDARNWVMVFWGAGRRSVPYRTHPRIFPACQDCGSVWLITVAAVKSACRGTLADARGSDRSRDQREASELFRQEFSCDSF